MTQRGGGGGAVSRTAHEARAGGHVLAGTASSRGMDRALRSPMPRNGNLRCMAPSLSPRAWRRFFTVSYTIEGTPTEVMYMILSSGSSIGRVERSSARGRDQTRVSRAKQPHGKQASGRDGLDGRVVPAGAMSRYKEI